MANKHFIAIHPWMMNYKELTKEELVVFANIWNIYDWKNTPLRLYSQTAIKTGAEYVNLDEEDYAAALNSLRDKEYIDILADDDDYVYFNLVKGKEYLTFSRKPEELNISPKITTAPNIGYRKVLIG